MADGESRPTEAPLENRSDEASEPQASAGLQQSETPPKTESQRAPVAGAHGAAAAPEAPVRGVTVPRWIQLVALPLLVLALWAVAVAAGPVLLIFAVAGVLALILNPVVRSIQRARVPRGLAVGLVYVLRRSRRVRMTWPCLALSRLLRTFASDAWSRDPGHSVACSTAWCPGFPGSGCAAS